MKKEKSNLILITEPSITNLEIKYITQAAKDGLGEKCGKYIASFEHKFAEYIGVKHAIATSSCHGALHMGLLGLRIKEGDEIILSDITWIASASVIKYLGAKPVFVDIDPKTWCIDPAKIEEKITPRTTAIMAISIYGHPPAMNEIMKIASKHGLYVIEDGAESVGSKYYNKRPGDFGDFGAFSFHGTKILTTQEGGMFVTNNSDLYSKVLLISNQGKDPSKTFWNLEISYKYKMTDLQAALGLAQLKRIDKLVAKKRQIFSWYKKRLENVSGIVLSYEAPHCLNTYWMPTIILDKKYGLKKEELIVKLRENDIMSRPFFYPLSSMPPFKTKTDNEIAYNISPYGINLPCGYNLTEEQADYVCDCLLKILKLRN